MLKLVFLIFCSVVSVSTFAVENPSILFVGDSHSYGKMGMTVESHLSKISDHVVMQSSCGATPNTWLGNNRFEKTVCGFWKKEGKEEFRSKEHQTPKFSDELSKYRPQVTIVQLGTNIAAGKNPAAATESIVKVMKAILKENSICIWIGPPDANSKIVTREKVRITNKLLSELAAVNECHYIDSLKLTSFPSNSAEGIHYPPQLSAQWGAKISLELIKIIKSL